MTPTKSVHMNGHWKVYVYDSIDLIFTINSSPVPFFPAHKRYFKVSFFTCIIPRNPIQMFLFPAHDRYLYDIFEYYCKNFSHERSL